MKLGQETEMHEAGQPSIALEMDGSAGATGLANLSKTLPPAFNPTFTQGKFGEAAVFDGGVGTGVLLGSPEVLGMTTGQGFTASAWVKLSVNAILNQSFPVFGTVGGSDLAFWEMSLSPDKITLIYNKHDSPFEIHHSVTPGLWFHIAYSFLPGDATNYIATPGPCAAKPGFGTLEMRVPAETIPNFKTMKGARRGAFCYRKENL